MKTGDKVLCKFFDGKLPYCRGNFKVGELYEIEVVPPMLPNQSAKIIFVSDGKMSYSFFTELTTYFYTPQEIRKLKLNKLEKC